MGLMYNIIVFKEKIMAKELVNSLNELVGRVLLSWDEDDEYLVLHFTDNLSAVLTYEDHDGSEYSPDISEYEYITDTTKYNLKLISLEEHTQNQLDKAKEREERKKELEKKETADRYKEYLKLKEEFEGEGS